jgi:hypothetical protein
LMRVARVRGGPSLNQRGYAAPPDGITAPVSRKSGALS